MVINLQGELLIENFILKDFFVYLIMKITVTILMRFFNYIDNKNGKIINGSSKLKLILHD